MAKSTKKPASGLQQVVTWTRFLIYIPVAALFIGSVALVLLGGYETVMAVYHAFFDGDGSHVGATSAVRIITPVKPKVTLSAPQIRSGVTLKKNRLYTTSGYLSPKHPAGAHSVVIKTAVYRMHHWSTGPTIVTTNRDWSTRTKWFSDVYSFAIAGHWRVQSVSDEDAQHSRTVSSFVYFWVQ